MAKKGILALALAAFVAGGVFAQEFGLSVGGGIMGEFGRVGGVNFDRTGNYAVPDFGDVSYHYRLNQMGLGAYAFLDATFLEVAVGFSGGPSMWSYTHSNPVGGSADLTVGGMAFALNLSLLGRFPIAVGESLEFFPLAGIAYNIVMSSRVDGNQVRGYSLNTFRLQLGVGADFDMNENMFLRTSLLGWYGFAPAYFARSPRDNETVNGGFGGTLRVGVGIRL